MKTAIVLHHSATSGDAPQFDDVREFHNRKWPGHGVAYHHFIEKDGRAKSEREEDSVGYHAGQWNNESIGVCLAGDFRNEDPREAQLETLTRLVQEIQNRWGIPDDRIFLHREVRPTQCPVIDLREMYFDRRVSDLSRRLKIAQGALDRVTGYRRFRLVRFIERLSKIFA